MPDVLARSPWPGVILTVILFSSDYVLTIVCARLYAERAKQKILIEGSFELNPVLQKHVDSGRWFSPRWAVGVGALCILFPVLWWLAVDAGWAEAYLFTLGGMLFLQVALQTRHLRNLFLFTTALGDDGIRGRTEYPRWVVLSTSAFEFVMFAGVYAAAYAVSGSALLLGGAVFCLVMGARHFGLRRRMRSEEAGSRTRR